MFTTLCYRNNTYFIHNTVWVRVLAVIDIILECLQTGNILLGVFVFNYSYVIGIFVVIILIAISHVILSLMLYTTATGAIDSTNLSRYRFWTQGKLLLIVPELILLSEWNNGHKYATGGVLIPTILLKVFTLAYRLYVVMCIQAAQRHEEFRRQRNTALAQLPVVPSISIIPVPDLPPPYPGPLDEGRAAGVTTTTTTDQNQPDQQPDEEPPPSYSSISETEIIEIKVSSA